MQYAKYLRAGSYAGSNRQCLIDPSWDDASSSDSAFPPKSIQTAKKSKTYNSWDSLVVTHPTTNQPISSLSMPERTG
jgi:hypothetical protein